MDDLVKTRADWSVYGIDCDQMLQARMDNALDIMARIVIDLGAPELVQDVLHEALFRAIELPARDADYRARYLRGRR